MAEMYKPTTTEDIRRQTMMNALFRRRGPTFQEANPPIDIPPLGTPAGNQMLGDPFLFNARYGGGPAGQASRDSMELVDPNQAPMDFADADVGDMTADMMGVDDPVDYAGIETEEAEPFDFANMTVEDAPSPIDYAGITMEEKPAAMRLPGISVRGKAPGAPRTEDDRRQRMRDYLKRRNDAVFAPMRDRDVVSDVDY